MNNFQSNNSPKLSWKNLQLKILFNSPKYKAKRYPNIVNVFFKFNNKPKFTGIGMSTGLSGINQNPDNPNNQAIKMTNRVHCKMTNLFTTLLPYVLWPLIFGAVFKKPRDWAKQVGLVRLGRRPSQCEGGLSKTTALFKSN